MTIDPGSKSQTQVLKDVLADVEAQIDSERARLAELDKEREALTAKIDQRATERRGLILSLQRLTDREPSEEQPPSTRPSGMVGMARTDAVAEILKSQDRAMSIREVTKALAEVGRDDSYESVSAALAYLKRKDRVHQPGRGQWMSGVDEWELDDSPLSPEEYEIHHGS